MIIKSCPPGLTPQQKKEWKRRLVILWLIEFKFSSIELLSKLLGQHPKHTSPFFKSMINDKFLVRFTSEYFPKKDLVRLGQSSLQWFPDLDQSLLRSDRHVNKKTIIHDYLVQKVISEHIDQYNEIDGRFDRTRKEAPDVFVVSRESGRKIAIEYELTRKNKDRTFALFIRYAKKISSQELGGVVFYFRSKPMYNLYKKRFETKTWPVFKKVKKDGKKLTEKAIEYEIHAQIRAQFSFRLDPPKSEIKDTSLSNDINIHANTLMAN